MAFADTTASAANPVDAAGKFVLRSTNPTFASDVQELTFKGSVPRAFGQHAPEFSILESFGIDWAYDKASRSIVVASDRNVGRAGLLFLSPLTFSTIGPASMALDWREKPSLLAEAERTLAP